MLVPKPPQLEATLIRARVFRLILLRSNLGKDGGKSVSGWHKAQSMSRYPSVCVLESGRLRSIPIVSKTRDRYGEAHVMSLPDRPQFRVLRCLLAAAIFVALCLLRWGGDLLIASDPAPQHVDAAVVLQGS